jgi:nicotinamide mononucleotide transporter
MNLLDINLIAFSVMDSQVSYLELMATFFGLISVYFATKENILTWPTGIINEFGFFFLFFQVNLYAGMLLQILFFIVTLYGWYFWKKIKTEGSVVNINQLQLIWLIISIVMGTFIFNFLVSHLHLLIPCIIKQPAVQSVLDSLVAVTSIAATYLLAKKILFAWVLWILVDLMSIGLFVSQQLYLVAIEYSIFMMMAIYGYIRWRKHCVQ